MTCVADMGMILEETRFCTLLRKDDGPIPGARVNIGALSVTTDAGQGKGDSNCLDCQACAS